MKKNTSLDKLYREQWGDHPPRTIEALSYALSRLTSEVIALRDELDRVKNTVEAKDSRP